MNVAWHAGRGVDPTRESGVARVDWRSTPVEPGVARTGCEQKMAMNKDDDDDNNDDDDLCPHTCCRRQRRRDRGWAKRRAATAAKMRLTGQSTQN